MGWLGVLLLKPLFVLAFGLLYWTLVVAPLAVAQRRWPGHWLLRERGRRGPPRRPG
jgi:hypothetical protein